MNELPNLNSKNYNRAARIDFLPYGEHKVLVQLKTLTQKFDGRKSSNCVHMTFEVLESDGEPVVGDVYRLQINLDRPGNFSEPGTLAYYAAIDLATFSAACEGLTTAEAQEQEIDLTERFKDTKALGEDLYDAEVIIEIVSRDKEKQMQDGTVQTFTNRYFNPAPEEG